MEMEGKTLNFGEINNFGLRTASLEEYMMYEEDGRLENEEKRNYEGE
jgi:hypothetical protein